MDGFTRMDGAMPEPRSGAGIQRLHDSAPEQLFRRFMQEFGGGVRQEFTSVVGELLIDDAMFRQKRRASWKILKGERAAWLLHTAFGIKSPDEIWVSNAPASEFERLHFLSRFVLGPREYGLLGCVSIFERMRGRDGFWGGVTNFATTDQTYVQKIRAKDGMRNVYRRRGC